MRRKMSSEYNPPVLERGVNRSGNFKTFSEKAERPLSNDYYISSDVSRFLLSHTNLIHLWASTFPPKKIMLPPSFSCPFYPALYIFPTYIQLLVPNLSMNLSLNLSKNDLKFYLVQYQHLILWAHLWCLCVPQAHVIYITAIYIFSRYIYMHTKHWGTLLQCIRFFGPNPSHDSK